MFSKDRVTEYRNNNALIVDVRTPQEFKQGALRDSVNIPLNKLNAKVDELRKKGRPVITVCRSGMRSGQAKSILAQHGIDVINGGPWDKLK